jgi:hypothetical protein
VKCGESHESQACQKTRDAAAKCANCGGPHTASYRVCPRFPGGYLGKKTPRETTQKPPKNRNPAIKKIIFDLLDAIQSSNSTEEILKKVLAIIPYLLSDC